MECKAYFYIHSVAGQFSERNVSSVDLNSILLFGGLATAGLTAVGMLVCVLVFRLKKEQLKAELEKEYGER